MSYGKSLALTQNSFLQPPNDDEPDEQEYHERSFRRHRRQANVFDAVAGRVNVRGFQPPAPYDSKYRDSASASLAPIRPEEALFRRLNAPTRYEENDFYFAHELLPPDCPLPGSEMLEAIHTYSADFYDRATVDRGRIDNQSMDETALIAMGILLEELAEESLGETGDLVLVEGEKVADEETLPAMRTGRGIGRERANSILSSGDMARLGDDLDGVARRKWTKRRKLNHRACNTDEDTGDPNS